MRAADDVAEVCESVRKLDSLREAKAAKVARVSAPAKAAKANDLPNPTCPPCPCFIDINPTMQATKHYPLHMLRPKSGLHFIGKAILNFSYKYK